MDSIHRYFFVVTDVSFASLILNLFIADSNQVLSMVHYVLQRPVEVHIQISMTLTEKGA